MKRVYFINNKEDFRHLLSHVIDLGADLYTQRGEEIHSVGDAPANIFIAYVYPHGVKPPLKNNHICTGNEFITLQSTILKEHSCMEGCITAEYAKGSEWAQLFLQISSYIKKNYIKSSTTSFIMSPSVYDDWVHKRVDFQFMFECRTFSVSAEGFNLHEYFEFITAKGYVVHNVFAGDNLPYDIKSDGFFICTPKSKKYFTDMAYGSKSYTSLSEGMFVYKSKKKKADTLSFYIDTRVLDGDAAKELELLYSITKKYFKAD